MLPLVMSYAQAPDLLPYLLESMLCPSGVLRSLVSCFAHSLRLDRARTFHKLIYADTVVELTQIALASQVLQNNRIERGNHSHCLQKSTV